MLVHAAEARDTEAFGARLAAGLSALDGRLAVLYLVGDLGAGKTTLARGFLQGLGVQTPVRSPTYTLVEVYEISGFTAVHLDLYRLSEPSELHELGLTEWARPRHVWLIEWPERGAGRLPPPDLVIRLTAGAQEHQIETSAATALGRAWIGQIR